jgi:ABC-type phosphate transport system substrate-binding protein
MKPTCLGPTLVVILFMTMTSIAAVPRRETIVFIASKDQTTTNLSIAEVRNIYLGRTTRWRDGHRITLIVRPATTPAGRAFLDRVVRLSEIDFSQNWLGVVFRGEASSPPQVIAPLSAVRKLLTANPDAIAFVLSSELVAEDEALVRVLTIDGKARDEDGYPFVVSP